MQIETLLSKFFCDLNNIDIDKNYTVEYVDAIELLVPERIDLIAKYKYIECREKGYDISFFKELYTKHIEAFSFGKCTEAGNPNKVSLQNYIDTFHALIDDIKKNGIDPNISLIPVGRNNVIMNGSHRVAIALYFGLKVPIVRFEHLYDDFGLHFFRQRKLDEKFLDYMVTEYIRRKKDVYIACLYPAAKGKENLDKTITLMKQKAMIIYQKEINFTSEGLCSFITQIYDCNTNPWIGTFENHYAGAYYKLKSCAGSEPVRIFVLSGDTLDKMKELKKEIRDLYQLGNHSIHITDTKEEAVSLANIVFNANSIHCLNHGKPDYYIKFNKKLDYFKKRLIENNFSPEDFIIDSSSVMGLYALRDIRDIDFMTLAAGYEVIEDANNTNHHQYLEYYNTTIENIILNPECYLVYNGLKFITLDVCKTFKKNRGEQKDKIDVRLINSIIRIEDMKLIKRYVMWIERKKRDLYYAYILYHRNKIFRKIKNLVKFILRKLRLVK